MSSRPGTALIVDGDNVPPHILGPLVQYLEPDGAVTERRVFRNWRSTRDAKGWDDATKRFAFERVDRYRTTEGKNGSDIAVAVESVDLFHAGFRRFCIVSGDTDFAPLVERLRRGGAHVTIVGHKLDGGLLGEIADRYVAWSSLPGVEARESSAQRSARRDERSAEGARSSTTSSGTTAAAGSGGRGRAPKASAAKSTAAKPAGRAAHGRSPRPKPAGMSEAKGTAGGAAGGSAAGASGATAAGTASRHPAHPSAGQAAGQGTSGGGRNPPAAGGGRSGGSTAPGSARGEASQPTGARGHASPRQAAKPRPKPEPRGTNAPQDLVALLQDAYQVALTDGEVDKEGWLAVDRLGMALQTLDRQFSPGKFGFGSRTPLSRLLQRIPGFEVQGVRRGRMMHYRVRLRTP